MFENQRAPHPTPAASGGKSSTPASQPRRSVLLCEDDDGIRDLLLDALRGEGYRVDAACNGREALECLQQGDRRSLVLLDLLMPEISGYEVLERMNTDPQLRGEHIVVIVSAIGFAQHLVSQGVFEKQLIRDFVKKPFELEDLLAVVQRWAQA